MGKKKRISRKAAKTPREEGELNHEAHEEGEKGGIITTKDTEGTKGRDERPRSSACGWAWVESRDAPATMGKKKRISRKAAKTPREEGELNLERVS